MSAYLARQQNSSTDGLQWRRSSRSVGMNNCVETALLGGSALAVRDSKDTTRPPLRFSAAAWTSFTRSLL
ncbi:DUF397 domain-containing protein [Streptomyces purpureus]|uniref:DUF397 domain-containing protein n=1 Tax=Streptomyces purpureus TaxID=1951 RepID=UPI0009989B9C|nr:DUF397 domain-containing protein [Streptomyces purpureus]